MKIFESLAKKVVFSVLNTGITIFILYWDGMTIINAFQTPDADWNQVGTFLGISAIILVIMWFLAFLKFLRNLIFLIIVLLLAGWCCLPQFLPNITDGMCVTMGSCKEGTEVKTVSGKIVINQQTCVKNGWSWNIDKKSCETKNKK